MGSNRRRRALKKTRRQSAQAETAAAQVPERRDVTVTPGTATASGTVAPQNKG